MKGRKKKQESRAAEFRQRLVEWSRLPESARPSLRALARELHTSHQMLAWPPWVGQVAAEGGGAVRKRTALGQTPKVAQ
jgi:hypothetical protein